jgi:uncharacterized protein YecE (DUF72 family)
MTPQIYIGTSGWNFRSWKESFYHGLPQKRWLDYYAQHLDALEVNGTFYHLMPASVLRGWYQRTPPGFRFALKGHRIVTHLRRLMPAPESLELQRAAAAELGEKLLTILWQLPPNLAKDPQRLSGFAAMLSGWREVRHVVEFRHPSWFDDEVAHIMREHRLAICLSDAADWPLWDAVSTDLVYVRLHGHRRTYASNYGRRALAKWAMRGRGWLAEGRSVHFYFDNDSEGHAPHNALALKRLMARAEASAAPTRNAIAKPGSPPRIRGRTRA